MDYATLECQAKISKRYSRIRQKPTNESSNETAVHYIYGDPVIKMIMDPFDYKLEIEERVNEKYQPLICLKGVRQIIPARRFTKIRRMKKELLVASLC